MLRTSAVVVALLGSCVSTRDAPPRGSDASAPLPASTTAAAMPSPASDPPKGSVSLVLTADRGGGTDVVVSTGVPFPPGALRDVGKVSVRDAAGREVAAKVTALATWPTDRSVRSVLVAFRATLASGASALYTVRADQPRKLPEPPNVAPNPDGPIAATLPASWYAASLVSGPQVPATANELAPEFETRIERGLVEMKPAYDGYGVSCGGTAKHRTYYDGVHAIYQRFLRGGDAARYRRARAEATWYRSNEIRWTGPLATHVCEKQGWSPAAPMDWGVLRRLLGQGMLDDYLVTGDPAARAAIIGMGEAVKQDLPALTGGREVILEITERNMAWPLLSLDAYYAVDPRPEVLAALKSVVDRTLAWQARGKSGAFEHDLNRPDPEECERGPHGGSPFMTALLVDALMDYHALTGDPRIVDSVRRVAGWLETRAITPDGKAFRYLWGCETDAYESSGTADLNLLIVPVFGAAYALTGDEHFLRFGDKIAEIGVHEMSVRDPKHWNQSMRGYGRYLGYRAMAVRAAAKKAEIQKP